MPIEFYRDGPWELPEGWVWARLGDLGRWTGGGTPSKSNTSFWMDGTIPWISPKDMKADIVGDSKDRITEVAVANSSTKLVPANSVLMVVRSGILNHTFPVAICDREVTLNQDMRALIPFEGINARFISLVLRRLQRHILYECSKDGTTVASVEPASLEKILVPIAPTAEQRRIVNRIDELFTELADGEAALASACDDLDIWRRALLKAAVTGELTREWRNRNKTNESGFDLLERLRSGQLAQPSKGRGRSRGAFSDPLDLSALPEIPNGWAWARLSELGEFGRGKSKHRPRDDARLYGGNMPFIQTGSVANCEDYIQKYEQTYGDFGIQQSKIWPAGTLCITIAANIAKTGILTFEACFPDSVVGLVPAPGVNIYYVHLWMQNIQARLEAFAPATAQKNINLEVLNSVATPLPPPLEQDAIVLAFKKAMEETRDGLAFVENLPQRANLRQAILKSSFEGRLVLQNPRDEPADRLFTRLRKQIGTTVHLRRTRRLRCAALIAE